MRRTPLRQIPVGIGLLICSAQPLTAQGVVSGFAIAADTERPLACIEVALFNAKDERVASMRTRVDGAFEFVAPDSGIYRFLFLAGGYPPVASEPEFFAPDVDRDRRYSVALRHDTSLVTYIDTAVVFRWFPTMESGSPRHPRGRNGAPPAGEVVARFTIDTGGTIIPGSVHIESSTHAEFGRVVREYLGWARYQPPVGFKGSPMCALVRWPFEFRTERS